jgi:DNA-binding LytR/AlgR family response regulator
MKQQKIAIVTNNGKYANEIVMQLTGLGYQVAPLAGNTQSAYKIIKDESPDLLMLDAHLTNSAIHIDEVNELRQVCGLPIILIGSSEDIKALDSIKAAHPDGIVFEPFTKELLLMNIEIVLANSITSSNHHDRYIHLKNGTSYIKVYLHDIVCVKSKSNYAEFQLSIGKRILVRSTLQSLINRIDSDDFLLLNRGVIININFISRIEGDNVIFPQQQFKLPKSKRAQLMKAIKGTIIAPNVLPNSNK